MKLSSIRTLKVAASSFFIVVGVLNLLDTVFVFPAAALRDVIILLVLASPLLLNKKRYYMGFGLLASLISLLLLIVYATRVFTSEDSLLFYLLGLGIFSLALFCSLVLVYVGTYSTDPKRFQLL